MTYSVRKGIIYSENGISESPRWFSDSRLSFQMDENAITEVEFFNPAATRGSNTIFLQRLWDGFRVFAEKEGTTHKLRHAETEIWPFGVESKCRLDHMELGHRVLAVEESIVLQLITPAEMPAGLRFKLEFYKEFALIPADSQDFRFNDRGAARTWREWNFDADRGMLRGSFADTRIEQEDNGHKDIEINNHGIAHEYDSDSSSLHIGIGADFPLRFAVRPMNAKFILTSDECLEPNRTYSFVIAFAPSEEGLTGRMEAILPNLGVSVERQFDRYRKVSESSPVLIGPYKPLNDFIGLAPMYHESCKVTDVPGAVKAKNATYWVWGWDGITSNYASFYWGDREFIREMLLFYEETADPEGGIAHSYRHDMTLNSISARPAQGMYISLLQQYYAATGDLRTVSERYAFAKRIFERILKREAQGTGLCEDASLFPDFPYYMKETGHDVSSLNNTIFYCAARSMDYLAGLMQDAETKRQAKSTFEKIENNFLPLFFDGEKGFVVSSIDAGTLQRRDSFNSNAVKWENHYCAELMDPVEAECLDFFEKNVVCKAGLREIPVWSEAFDMDANQLHCWWPVTGEYYMRLINGGDRADLIEQWIGWVGYWTDRLTCPEGISCYIDTDEPDVDRWNSKKGAWHAYSMRGWYQAAIHGVVGVGMESGGLTFYPYSGEEMTLLGLHFQNNKFDIHMKGSGPYIQAIEIDGRTFHATNKLPADAPGEGERSEITVYRTAVRPFPVIVQEGYGLGLLDYSCKDGIIRARVQGAGTCRLKLSAAVKPAVAVNGPPMEVLYDAKTGTASVKLELSPDRTETLEIREGAVD